MPKFVAKPVEIEAVQFTGDNWKEMQFFTGTWVTKDGHEVLVFNPIGTYLPFHLYRASSAELWVASIFTHLVLDGGDWVVRGDRGFFPWRKKEFEAKYTLVEERRNDA